LSNCLAYAADRSWSIGTNTVSLRNGRFVTKSRTQPTQQQMSSFATEEKAAEWQINFLGI